MTTTDHCTEMYKTVYTWDTVACVVVTILYSYDVFFRSRASSRHATEEVARKCLIVYYLHTTSDTILSVDK